MVRLLSRLTQRLSAPSPTPTRRTLPPPGVLRRERRAVLRARDERLRDLGGLLLEMYRRDSFREDLLEERCSELLELEARLHELESLLSAPGQGIPAGRCQCGAPYVLGSHFCANCGRPAGEQAVIACDVCGHALPADASFCASCGSPVGELALDAAAESVEIAPQALEAAAEPEPDSVER